MTLPLLEAHTKDLTKDGMWDHSDPKQPKRHPVCSEDVRALDTADHAVRNSCSLGLKQRITNTLTNDEQHCGPYVLFEVFLKTYNPSHARVNKLIKQLEAADLRSYPGENVTLFVKWATEIIKEIKLTALAGRSLKT